MALQLALEQRVINIVVSWGNPIPFPVKKTSTIKDIWGDRGDTVPFPDPATDPLISSLQDAFESGTDARVLTQLTPDVFGTGGAITTLKDLISWIDDAPEPRYIVTDGFADDAVKAEFASSVAGTLNDKPLATQQRASRVPLKKTPKQQ
jgi:hypothetical protein